jgi:hypothetical protein
LHGLFPAIDQIALIFRPARQCPPVFEVVKVAGGHRLAGFDLNRCDSLAIHQISCFIQIRNLIAGLYKKWLRISAGTRFTASLIAVGASGRTVGASTRCQAAQSQRRSYSRLQQDAGDRGGCMPTVRQQKRGLRRRRRPCATSPALLCRSLTGNPARPQACWPGSPRCAPRLRASIAVRHPARPCFRPPARAGTRRLSRC